MNIRNLISQNLFRSKITAFVLLSIFGISFSPHLLLVGNEDGAEAEIENNEVVKLNQLLAEERAFYYQHFPSAEPANKRVAPVDRLPQVDAESQQARANQYQVFLEALDAIDAQALTGQDLINYQLFERVLSDRIMMHQHKTYLVPLTSDSGFHSYLPRNWQSRRFQTAKDYEAYLRWMQDIPRYFEEQTLNLKDGLAVGMSLPKAIIPGLLPTFQNPTEVESVEASDFYKPFAELPSTLTDAQKSELRSRAQQIIGQEVFPAYVQLAKFMESVYFQTAKSSLAACDFPNGKSYYADIVKYYTTVDITPEEVHQTGLQEVKRIRKEMEQIIRELDFEGDFQSFLTFLRTDPQFYAKTEKELLMFASYVAKRIDGRLPQLFKNLPRQPYGVEAVPASIAPNYTIGRYYGAPLDAPRGGYYWVNTYALQSRPLYVIPALTLHEAAPGHHTQIALAKEIQGIAEFRNSYFPHAYGEGWALYAEKIGAEMGIYETPYEHFGRLTYEMWRACRLVIDTGLHHKHWDRQTAIDLLAQNTALSEHNIQTEVDRYISWPGQALSYKIGELKIMELRKLAETELGDKFDVRDFHWVLLKNGGLPLDLVETQVKDWIEAIQG